MSLLCTFFLSRLACTYIEQNCLNISIQISSQLNLNINKLLHLEFLSSFFLLNWKNLNVLGLEKWTRPRCVRVARRPSTTSRAWSWWSTFAVTFCKTKSLAKWSVESFPIKILLIRVEDARLASSRSFFAVRRRVRDAAKSSRRTSSATRCSRTPTSRKRWPSAKSTSESMTTILNDQLKFHKQKVYSYIYRFSKTHENREWVSESARIQRLSRNGGNSKWIFIWSIF